MNTNLPPSPPASDRPVGDPSEATSTEALRAQAEFTRRRLERQAGELLHELKPTSLIRTQPGRSQQRDRPRNRIPHARQT